MFRDLLKDALLKNTVEAFQDEKITETFNKVFDSLETEEQVSAFKDFLGIAIEKIKEISDSQEEEIAEEDIEKPDSQDDDTKKQTNDDSSNKIEEPKPEETLEDDKEQKPVADDKNHVTNLENTFAILKTTSVDNKIHIKKVNAMLKNL